MKPLPPLFTVSWLLDSTPKQPEVMQTDRDILQALVNAAGDRGDRSYDQLTGLWAWQGNLWRLEDVHCFLVDLDTHEERLEDAVEWLKGRGWPDEEFPKGYVHSFLLRNGLAHTLGSVKATNQLTKVIFPSSVWLVAERWAINLNYVSAVNSIYGDLSIIQQNWTASH